MLVTAVGSLLLLISPGVFSLKQVAVEPPKGNSFNASHGPFDRPALQLSFSMIFNSTANGLQHLSADVSRQVISGRNVKEFDASVLEANCNDRPAHDGFILDVKQRKQFSHQRFFGETVCYEMDLGPNLQMDATTCAQEGKFSGISKGGEPDSSDEENIWFYWMLGETIGAPLDLYSNSSIVDTYRSVAGRLCTVWGADRAMRQPLGEFAESPALGELGWRAPPAGAMLRAQEAAKRSLAQEDAAGLEAVLLENATFCVTASGELLATSSSRRLAFLRQNGKVEGAHTIWEVSQEASAAYAPRHLPGKDAFDSVCGVAGGRCVDLKQGTVGPSELKTTLNAEERLKRINSEAQGGWHAVPYRLWDGVTVGHLKRSLGTELGPLTLPLKSAVQGEVLSGFGGSQEVPNSFDARSRWPRCLSIGQVRNQGSCGSCWAFSSAAVLSDRFCVAGQGSSSGNASVLLQEGVEGSLGSLSLAPEHLVDCDPKNHGCQGGRLDDAWTYLQEHGVPSEACRPYSRCTVPTTPRCSYRADGADASHAVGHEHGSKAKCQSTCEGGGRMHLFHSSQAYAVAPPGDVRGLQRELMQNGPVQVAFFVFSDFHSYGRGVYSRTPGAYGPLGGHAVRMIGWGIEETKKGKKVDYWLVANSWSPSWGMGGFFRILRGTNECGIETTPAAGLPELSAASGQHQN